MCQQVDRAWVTEYYPFVYQDFVLDSSPGGYVEDSSQIKRNHCPSQDSKLQERSAHLSRRLWDQTGRHQNGLLDPNLTMGLCPLLGPSTGPATFRITTDFTPIIWYSMKHKLLLPIIDEEVTKWASSRLYSSLCLSQRFGSLCGWEVANVSVIYQSKLGLFTDTRPAWY